MRFRTLEIRWHDSKPISSCDFQPVAPFKKARALTSYRLATGGEDNHVRLWGVHPHLPPRDASSTPAKPEEGGLRPARVEYLATLSRHSHAVNVVRWSPSGELLASAGDDGFVILWAQSASASAATYGSDLSAEELKGEKEFWRPRTTWRASAMQVYDLAWSPTGEFLVVGSTDNTARVFAAADGKCMHEIAEHSHYVQGVAWDPLGEYIATQSSDRAMHVYRVRADASKGTFEAHAVGRNTRFPTSAYPAAARRRTPSTGRHSRTPSMHDGQRPRMFRSASIASDVESVSEVEPWPPFGGTAGGAGGGGPLTPASLAPTPASGAAMFPPPAGTGGGGGGPSSRRSSFSGSNAPSSPSGFSAVSGFSRSAYGRSPSPMPALPAIRTPPSTGAWAGRYRDEERERGVRMYGDEGYSNFFRRLGFSPDGALLLTPAGTFEDPSVGGWEVGAGWDGLAAPVAPATSAEGEGKDEPARGGRARPVISTNPLDAPGTAVGTGSVSSVYIYSRANFARPPVAQLPGHKKASVAVRFGPVLFELRPNVGGGAAGGASASTDAGPGKEAGVGKEVEGPRMGVGTATFDEGEGGEGERDVEGRMDVDLVGPIVLPPPSQSQSQAQGITLAAPAPQRPGSASAFDVLASPALSPADRRPPTPAASKPSTPAPGHTAGHGGATPGTGTGSIFALPYRMLYAVVTMDTVAIYDTQQAGPVCLLTKLHYDEFTDLTWSPDGQCLMLSSRDGYCTLVTFDEFLPAHHTQQAALQLQQIAAQHSVPISYAHAHATSAGSTHAVASGSGSGNGSGSRKRPLEPLTPAASVDGDRDPFPASGSTASLAPTEVEMVVEGAPGSMDKAAAGEGAEQGKAEDADADGPPKKKRRVALTRVGDL
ncbi:chromatin assembly complex protein [Mycena maculata]|uniref:Chromatin assembly complex protein n=1 Tax=Mycena maculata TaxID=230809 RepID=A0AAD7JMG9_9AGAR|nr:chromatin assembly complex protein [Mycena maculata]